MIYVVLDTCSNKVIAGFRERADAEEFCLAEAEEWVYEVMVNEDPREVCGYPCWDFKFDYDDLLINGFSDTYIINEVPLL